MASLIRKPLGLTAATCGRLHRLPAPPSITPSSYLSSCSGSDSMSTRWSEFNRVPNLAEGCDYAHWLVVMDAPNGFPSRNDIVRSYVSTLAVALGSEEEAKRSIYSVSTKYYYAFGCRVPEILTYRIKSLPKVKWVLADSYISEGKNEYGGEPFVEGEVVPYDDEYHVDWVRDQSDEMGAKKCQRKTRTSST